MKAPPPHPWTGILKCAVLLAALAGAAPCGSQPEDDRAIPIALLLSYSGVLAAGSINSERAVILAIETANRAGGIDGRPLALLMRDSGADPTKATPVARELVERGAAVFIGPDTVPLAVHLKALWGDRTVILPSFITSDLGLYKPFSWFVMGAAPARIACELRAQLVADGRRNPLVLVDPTGYNYLVGRELGFLYGFPQAYLPTDQSSSEATVRPITSTPADAYVLAALPISASSLVYTLAAIGALGDPTAWYLSPTLHAPDFLATLPKGMLQGAHGVGAGQVAGAADYREYFFQRWGDTPFDDAYAFYDAGAIAALALQRASTRDGTIPTGAGLSPHIVAVTHGGGIRVRWNELDRGLALLRQGQEVGYIGLSGMFEFDATGKTMAPANTSWWTIGPENFVDVPSLGNCR